MSTTDRRGDQRPVCQKDSGGRWVRGSCCRRCGSSVRAPVVGQGLFIVGLLALVIAGCAQRGPVVEMPPLAARVESAQHLAAQGDLARALTQLEIAAAMADDDVNITRQIRGLRDRMQQQLASHREQVRRALKRGDSGAARRALLAALSLDPNDRELLQQLRTLEEKRSRRLMEQRIARAQSKIDSRSAPVVVAAPETEAYEYSRQAVVRLLADSGQNPETIRELERHLHSYPQDREMRNALLNLYLQQAQTAFAKDAFDRSYRLLRQAEQQAEAVGARKLTSVRQLRKTYAERLYTAGLRVYRSDPEQALEFWRYTLVFDPSLAKARLRLRAVGAGAPAEQ